jgi:hypothetical protein
MRRLLVSLISFATACATADAPTDPTNDTSDDEAETATPQIAPAAAPPFAGLYTTHATTHQNGDITSLQLLTATHLGTPQSTYVRERCYHTNCALPLPETDHYDSYTSAAGKTYLRFWSFTAKDDGTGLVTTPAIADVYEVLTTSYGIKLRKSYTSRWLALYKTTPAKQCTATGGMYTTDCACPLNIPGEYPKQVFVPGAGGCLAMPGDNESNCDGSMGQWADDDATLTGAYCVCQLGYYDDATGTCAAI